ncbi:MAG: RdgB/HAM1 family non-canonical purine NTP pyrophosphatase [Gammaproteobacteria bacterium]|nr:RdgB/HAM1 family non-canonical purine NTP pyrophosphatase [Gammaproteobacteria bacterium]
MGKIKRVVLASNNPGKLREISEMLVGLHLELLSQSEFKVPGIQETGATFVENAILKARNAARHTGLPAIGDDSGIEVDALNGEPGIYSSRYAGEGASDEANLIKLVEVVRQIPEDKRITRFICLMVYLRHPTDPSPIIAEGIWEGIAVTEPKGKNGFGYDPMFFVPGYNCTSAELPPEIKNQISHRAQALKKLIAQLNTAYTCAK